MILGTGMQITVQSYKIMSSGLTI